ncbi:MAG: hypothetical protein ACE5KV_00965 [Thermoplasmata archaeon]
MKEKSSCFLLIFAPLYQGFRAALVLLFSSLPNDELEQDKTKVSDAHSNLDTLHVWAEHGCIPLCTRFFQRRQGLVEGTL